MAGCFWCYDGVIYMRGRRLAPSEVTEVERAEMLVSGGAVYEMTPRPCARCSVPARVVARQSLVSKADAMYLVRRILSLFTSRSRRRPPRGPRV